MKNFFSKKKQLDVRTINMWEHNSWGDSIEFIDWDNRKIVGHMTPRPNEGDILRGQMESGKIGRFSILDMQKFNDPPDMFFAVVKDIGYE